MIRCKNPQKHIKASLGQSVQQIVHVTFSDTESSAFKEKKAECSLW